MIKYIAKRLLIFIPTLIIISLLAFVISLNSPTDPVENLVNASVNESDLSAESGASEKLRQEVRKKLGLDLPVFFLSLSNLAQSDTLYKIPERSHQENLSRLTERYGSWDAVQTYYHNVIRLKNSLKVLSSDTNPVVNQTQLNEMTLASNSLLETYKPSKVAYYFSVFDTVLAEHDLAEQYKAYAAVVSSYEAMQSANEQWKTYIPWIDFYGQNQYSMWLFGNEARGRKGIVRGDFGLSYSDNKPVGQKMLEVFPNSFFLVLFSVVFAYLISIPLGVYSAYKKDGWFDKVTSVVVFMLYSLPSFFVATWLLYKFANPDNLLWFPVNGDKNPSTYNNEWGFFSWERIKHQAPFFTLPIIAFTYSSFAFTSRIMRSGMIDVLGSDYIRTARAKGLSEKTVVLKHALRNGLLPIITMFANVFPAAIGGSVILETIFGIPGMGSAIYEAILGVDVPMIVAVFTLTGVLTVFGYLVSDILYALIDPRISYTEK